jgi:hypothetical protein
VLILVSGATATRRKVLSKHLGCLIVPGSGNVPFDGWWGADNGAFTGFDAELFLSMLERLRACDYAYRRCVFVAAPDVLERRPDGSVVGNAAKTLEKFTRWAVVIRAFGFPVALVAQDGLTIEATPWIEMDALFIGGSTEWKLGPEAEALAIEAKRNRKWVHMGRVNTKKRFRHAARIGCDSVDGTFFSRWPDHAIPKGLGWMEQHDRQPELALGPGLPVPIGGPCGPRGCAPVATSTTTAPNGCSALSVG